MNIKELLRKDFIIESMEAVNKRDALAELSGVFKRASQVDSEEMLQVLLEREKLGSTGIGNGIAIPHGKLSSLNEMLISFGRSKRGIEFEAMDGKPVHLFFLLMAPENSAGQHLRALAKISRMLKDADFRKSLIEAETADELMEVIAEKDDLT